ncbi:MAG: CHAT domain-containing protein [Cyanobacteria bacterium P01_A01_bin.105]
MVSFRCGLCCSILLAGAGLPAIAQVTAAGAGTAVTPLGNTFQIEGGTVAGDNLFHELGQFDLAAEQTAHFLSAADTVNIFGQIVGGAPATVDGLLRVTGSSANLYLINPAGLMLGPNARLDLSGSFTATTADEIGFGENWLSVYGTNDYAALVGTPDRYGFSLAEPGAVISEGQLAVSPGQFIHLVGGDVVNSGSLSAPDGEIALVGVPGQHRLQIRSSNSLLGLELEPMAGLTATDIPSLLTGGHDVSPTTLLTRADGAVQLGDCVGLTCAVVSGALQAGEITITAPAVSLVAAEVTAVTATRGQIRIGGDYQGQPSLPAAQQTTIDSASTVSASAVSASAAAAAGLAEAGGQIIVWADDTARVHGELTADNGFIETSGKRQIDLSGARIQAAGGAWLIDPTDIAIQAGATGANQIAPATIEAQLDAGTNVTITTAGAGPGAGDITLVDSIDQQGGGDASLSLIARAITFSPGRQINLTSAGTLTLGLNQVNPQPGVTTAAVGNVLELIGTVRGERIVDLGPGTYTGGTILIDRDVTVRGAGRDFTQLVGDGTYRLLEVLPGVTATLEGLGFVQGRASLGGGLLNEGTLTLNNSLLENNQATVNGGGLYNRGQLQVSDTVFLDNTATADAGAIYGDDNSFTTIINSVFDSNAADTLDGGAIHLGDDAMVVVEGSDFTNNTAQSSGGAISNHHVGAVLTVTNSTFSNNVAGSSGGAIVTRNGAQSTVIDSVLQGNTAVQTGGALAVLSGGALTVREASLDSNAAREGGAIGASGATLTVSDSLVQGNSATRDGGGIYTSSATLSEFQGLQLQANQAGDQGGGIYFSQGSEAKMASSILANNQANTDGGAIAVNGTGVVLTLNDTQLLNNLSGRDGGAIYAALGGQATVTHSEVVANAAQGQGGGFYVGNTSQISLDNSTVADNTAALDGGGVATRDAGQVTISRSTLSNNQATATGGGLDLDAASDSLLRNVTLSGNQATLGGGLALGGSASVSLENVTVANNQSSVSGGGLSNPAGGVLSMQNVIVADNQAPSSPDVDGAITSLGHNLVSIRGSSTGYGPADLPDGADARLGPLTDNGGPTATHLIQVGSAAIDAGQPVGAAVTDQRGQVRGAGLASDIGAVEFIPDEAAIDPNVPDGGSPPPVTLPLLSPDPGRFDPTRFSLNNPRFVSPRLEALWAENRQLENAERQFLADSAAVGVRTAAVTAVDEVVFQQLERRLGESYERYWSTLPAQDLTLQQVQDILRRAQQLHQHNAAVIYPLFVAPQLRGSEAEAPQPVAGSPSLAPAINRQGPDNRDGQRELVLLVIPAVGEPLLRRVGVSETTVLQQVKLFRTMAADPEDAQGYRPLAQQFYHWLVAPVEPDLRQLGIDQLIYSPDEGLRTLPLAAMHDGEQFVVDRFGLSMVPSMSLTQFGFDTARFDKTLAGGASEFEQLAALPGVAVELDRVGAIAPNTEVLFNQDFTLDNLLQTQAQLNPDVLHLATHAEFTAGDAGASYIQFWDTKLSLDRLETYDWQAVELLILSACTTALGSPDAELGFAGLAMAAGVESTIGSLWAVSDIATLALMDAFYQQLRQGKGRAEALQNAQRQLIQGEIYLHHGQLVTPDGVIDLPEIDGLPERADFTHPFYWSAFVAVGNPWL